LAATGTDINEEIGRIEDKAAQALADLYVNLTPWQKTLVARHPQRPHFSDFIKGLVTEFTPLAGDRKFGEDAAIVAGLGFFRGRRIALLGHEKGSSTESRIKHNFGMARPEGYRKAVRLMEMADRFNIPVLALVDTAGAYPGIGAEERGQSEAIGKNLYAMAGLRVPVVVSVIGEGGSGGALAIAVGDTTLMMQYSTYSVISPEGCAAILWKSAENAGEAAESLGITAARLKTLGVIDKVITEPLGGAHRDPAEAAKSLKKQIQESLRSLQDLSADALLERRQERWVNYGKFKELAE